MSFGSTAAPSSDILSQSADLVPATFWRRLLAGFIDFFLLALVIFSLGKLCSASKHIADIFVVPLALASCVYTSAGHALYGRTVGKYFLKIQVVRVDGTPAGWVEALRRSSVDGLFGIVWLTGLLSALSQLPPEVFHMQGWSTLYKSLAPQFPRYVQSVLEISG